VRFVHSRWQWLSKQLAQLIELPVRFFELLGEKPDALDEHADMGDGSLGDAWGNNQRLLFQDGKNLGRADPSNAMAPQEFLDLCLTQPGRLGRGGRRLPQLQNPFFRKIGIELEQSGDNSAGAVHADGWHAGFDRP
jgi:hypothetical protein